MKVFITLIVFSLCLISTATASLVGSKHDFSYLEGEPCAYCHSVHNGVGGLGRPAYAGSLPDIKDVYDTDSIILDPLTPASAGNSDAPLCLACHDGTFAAANIGTDISGKILGTKLDIGGYNGAASVLLDGSSLKDDHPVGFVFDASKDPTKIKAPLAESKVHVTFGPGKNEMWCSSCHNVHNNTYIPFLSMDNSGSALCLECHIK